MKLFPRRHQSNADPTRACEHLFVLLTWFPVKDRVMNHGDPSWSCWLVAIGSPPSWGPLFLWFNCSLPNNFDFLSKSCCSLQSLSKFLLAFRARQFKWIGSYGSYEQRCPKCLRWTKPYQSVFGKWLYSESLQDLFDNRCVCSQQLSQGAQGWWGCCFVQNWDLPLARAACSIQSSCRNQGGAGSYFLPFKLLHTFLLTFQPEISYFLTTAQGSTFEILLSLGFTTPPHTHNTFYLTPEWTQSTCLDVQHPGWGWGKATQYTDHTQQAKLLLHYLLKTWLFVQAGFWNIWFGAGEAELTNWMIAPCATTTAEKEGASGIIQVLDCFFQ